MGNRRHSKTGAMAAARDPEGAAGGQPQPNAELVEGWLAEFAAGLRGPARVRAGVVAELRDGLLEAVDAHRDGGLAPAEAARAALREFGEPAAIAAAFAPEMAARAARRTAAALIGTGPLVGLLWGLALVASGLLNHAGQAGPPWMWPQLPATLRVVCAALATVLAVGICAGLFAVTPGQWLPHRVRQARSVPAAAATLCVAALTVDMFLLATLGVAAVAVPERLVWAPVTVAGLASLTRLVLNARATRRLLATRAAVA